MPVNGRDRIVTALFENNKAAEFYISDPDEESLINNIYVGHVSKVIKEAGGAFVRFADKTEGFLPLGRSKNAIYKNKKNTDEIKAEDELLVLVETDALKTKLHGLTAEIKLTGKYLVITTGFTGFNYSKKLSKEEKERLSEELSKFETEYGFIVRTQSRDADIKDVIREAQKLSERLSDIVRYGVSRPAGTCLYSSDEIWGEKLKQIKSDCLEAIVTDDINVYDMLMKSDTIPDGDREKIKFYDDQMVSLYRLNNMEAILDSATQKKVWLKSGGSLIIEQTEAFVCIDVNTSKNIKKNRADELFLEINIEAACEVLRQIRLRQLSGTILIDFINMNEKSSYEELLETVREIVKRDPSEVNVIDITKLGIMEMTRKKRGKSLKEQLA